MKGRKNLVTVSIVAAAALAVGAGTFMTPALASDEDTIIAVKADDTVIDKPFEEAVLKHFQKRFFNRIGATDEQKSQLSAIFAKRQEASRPIREQLRHEFRKMLDLLAKDDATKDQIKKQQATIRSLRDQLADGRLDTVLQVRAVLTAEQKQKIHDRIQSLLSGDFQPRHLTGFALPARVLVGQLFPGN